MQVWLTLLHEVRLRKPSIMTEQAGKINLLSGHIEVSEMVPFLIWIIRYHRSMSFFNSESPAHASHSSKKGKKSTPFLEFWPLGLKKITSKKMSKTGKMWVTFEVDFSFKHWENQEVQDPIGRVSNLRRRESIFMDGERTWKPPTKFSIKVETLPSFSEKGIFLCQI